MTSANVSMDADRNRTKRELPDAIIINRVQLEMTNLKKEMLRTKLKESLYRNTISGTVGLSLANIYSTSCSVGD
jgi:hypothetical protein